jgi:hypothetical protein
MATTISSAALVPVTQVLSNTERLALAGFLAGYSGLTRQAYELDLRQYTAWCQPHQLRLFQARRAEIECFARDLEASGRARATITRRLCTRRRVLPVRGRGRPARSFSGCACAPSAAGLRITRHRPGSQRARRARRARAHLPAGPERAAGIRSRWRRYRRPGHRARAPDAGAHPQGRQGRHGTAGAAHRPGNRSGRWRAHSRPHIPGCEPPFSAARGAWETAGRSAQIRSFREPDPLRHPMTRHRQECPRSGWKRRPGPRQRLRCRVQLWGASAAFTRPATITGYRLRSGRYTRRPRMVRSHDAPQRMTVPSGDGVSVTSAR